MNDKRIYIDYNATTPLKDEVKEVLKQGFDLYGNASSLHASGREARVRIEEARTSVADLIGARPQEIIFTSGGSESNNTVFYTMEKLAQDNAGGAGRNHIITTAVEHPCVLNSATYLGNKGIPVTILPVDKYGKVKMDVLEKTLFESSSKNKAALQGDPLFVSIMTANNETGTIEDIKTINSLVKKAGAFMHTDAVQAAGKIPLNVKELDIDYLTLSSHKIYGPKGIGALYVRKGSPLYPLIHGGHHEEGLRAGTYNNLGIIGFGKAAELALRDLSEYQSKMSHLRLRLKNGLFAAIPDITINGHPDDVLPNTLNISFPGAEGEAILLSMDLNGIEASTGSACASGSLDPSHVLLATGAGPELAHGSIRFSLGWGIEESDIDYIIEILPPIIFRLRSMSTIKKN